MLDMPWWSGPVAASWVVLGAALAAVTPDPPPVAEAVVSVVDPGPEGHRGIEIRGCEHAAPPMTTADGTLRFAVVADGCELRVLRWDGGMPAASAARVLDADVGAVTVALPAWTAGGLGVWFEPTFGGMRVEGLLDGYGADRAGLRPGDVIVAVDGESVRGLSPEAFKLAVAGPEGSRAAVVAWRHGERRAFSVERRFLEP